MTHHRNKYWVLGAVALIAVVSPLVGWARWSSASTREQAAAAALQRARAAVQELSQSSDRRGRVLDPMPEADIVAGVNAAVTDAGLSPAVVRELTTRIEAVRGRQRSSSSIQRTQLTLAGIEPVATGRVLVAVQTRLPSAVPVSVRLSHTGGRGMPSNNASTAANRFDTVIVLEQLVLRDSDGETNR